MATCNICGSQKFVDFKTRARDKCVNCKSFGRHRLALHVYQQHGMFSEEGKATRRILHFAPERSLHGVLQQFCGTGYVCADAVPSAYPHAECLRIFIPEGLSIFPAQYFDYIIHNHVMEHIPGSFRDHIPPMLDILKIGGKMIFSVPGSSFSLPKTEEGGENLTEAERLARFKQSDHLKIFGRDFPEYLQSLPGALFSQDDVSKEDRERLSVPPGNRILILEKSPLPAGRRWRFPTYMRPAQAALYSGREPVNVGRNEVSSDARAACVLSTCRIDSLDTVFFDPDGFDPEHRLQK